MRRAFRTSLPGPGGHAASVAWRYEARPLRWAALFGREARLEVELGFGDGAFLVRSARERPDADFVGIETHWKRCQQALNRARRDGVANVRIVHADARLALARLFAPRTIYRLTALFPTPWRKRRDEGQRFFSRANLTLLNSRLHDEGVVRVVSDDAVYAAWVESEVPRGYATAVRLVGAGFETYYERRWINAGVAAFTEITLTKVMHVDGAIVEDVPVRTHFARFFDAARFAPVAQHGPTTVVFHEFVFDPVRQRALQHAIIVDDGFKQDAWISIVREGEGWRVRPVRQASTVPTPGLQRAVDLVFEALAPPAT